MTFDRSEWEKLQETHRARHFEQMLPKLEIMRQGAVAAELLTGNAAWDAFLRYLQGAIETTREQLVTLQNALASPELLDQTRLLQTKVSALRCMERISAWEAAMQLPKELAEYGEQAADLVSRMEKISDGNDRRADGED